MIRKEVRLIIKKMKKKLINKNARILQIQGVKVKKTNNKKMFYYFHHLRVWKITFKKINGIFLMVEINKSFKKIYKIQKLYGNSM